MKIKTNCMVCGTKNVEFGISKYQPRKIGDEEPVELTCYCSKCDTVYIITGKKTEDTKQFFDEMWNAIWEPEPVIKRCIGQKYTGGVGGGKYILCASEPGKVALVNLRNGWLWDVTNAVDMHDITKKEWEELTESGKFELIEDTPAVPQESGKDLRDISHRVGMNNFWLDLSIEARNEFQENMEARIDMIGEGLNELRKRFVKIERYVAPVEETLRRHSKEIGNLNNYVVSAEKSFRENRKDIDDLKMQVYEFKKRNQILEGYIENLEKRIDKAVDKPWLEGEISKLKIWIGDIKLECDCHTSTLNKYVNERFDELGIKIENLTNEMRGDVKAESFSRR